MSRGIRKYPLNNLKLIFWALNWKRSWKRLSLVCSPALPSLLSKPSPC